MDTRRDSSWKDWALHIMVGIVMAMTGLSWSTMAERVEQIDKFGSRSSRDRLAVTETRVDAIQRDLNTINHRQQRIEDKLDALLEEMRRR